MRQRGAMTALIWKCQGMDVYVPEIVQTFGVQTLEKVHLTVAIERRVRPFIAIFENDYQ